MKKMIALALALGVLANGVQAKVAQQDKEKLTRVQRLKRGAKKLWNEQVWNRKKALRNLAILAGVAVAASAGNAWWNRDKNSNELGRFGRMNRWIYGARDDSDWRRTWAFGNAAGSEGDRDMIAAAAAAAAAAARKQALGGAVRRLQEERRNAAQAMRNNSGYTRKPRKSLASWRAEHGKQTFDTWENAETQVPSTNE